MASAVDTFITYQFIKILTTKWEDMPAYKHGIIDEKGKLLKKYRTLKTNDEKNSYTIFHRVVWNLKRILEKLPFGRTRLASYAAGLFLLKEKVHPEHELQNKFTSFLVEEGLDEKFQDELCRTEVDNSLLHKGEYKLLINNFVHNPGDIIIVTADSSPVSILFGNIVYKGIMKETGDEILFTRKDVKRYRGGSKNAH